MNSSVRPRHPPLLLFGLLALAVVCIAVSPQSLWIDEAETALKAVQPTLDGWWHALYSEHNSNLQLPVYMIYVWGWARVFGVSELALRAANIPWFVLGIFAIAHFLRRQPGLRIATLLLYCVHPFVWYYLNEARPYLMQLSGALLVAGALFEALETPEEPLPATWWWLFWAGVFILCGAGLLGVPWAAAVTLLLMMRRPGFLRSMFRPGMAALLVFIPLLALLAVYFAWTLRENAGPGEAGGRLASIPFVFYEHLGFTGLGPGRAAMRSGGVGIFVSYLPSLCLLGIPLIFVLGRGAAIRFGLPREKFLPVCCAVLIPAASIFVLGEAKHFRVLGRHLTPLFPFILCALGFGITRLWESRRILDRALVFLTVAALAISALECRFSWRHAKDDYKDAAAIARAALGRGEEVWWAGAPQAAAYYQVPCSKVGEPGTVQLLWQATPTQLDAKPPAAVIIFSKPDLFDAAGGLSEYIAVHHYRLDATLPAFTIWKAP